MTYITGHDRSQLLLLPEAVDDYVGSDNPWRSAEALHLRLPEPGALEPPAGGGNPPQYRGDLAAAAPETRLQDHCRLPARQPQRLPPCVPSVCAALSPT